VAGQEAFAKLSEEVALGRPLVPLPLPFCSVGVRFEEPLASRVRCVTLPPALGGG